MQRVRERVKTIYRYGVNDYGVRRERETVKLLVTGSKPEPPEAKLTPVRSSSG